MGLDTIEGGHRGIDYETTFRCRLEKGKLKNDTLMGKKWQFSREWSSVAFGSSHFSSKIKNKSLSG